jgi:calcineurin-like phosphoesterase family protein
MARPALDWLITDTHWYHEAMVDLCGRPADFSERLIAQLRHHLTPQDRLFHLGDVIFYQYPRLKEILADIPGTKILLMGNHDRRSPGWYARNGFAFVADMIVVGDVLLSHKPVEICPSGVRLNVHGHWHNNIHHPRPDWYEESRYRLLSVEATNYKPVKFMEFVR